MRISDWSSDVCSSDLAVFLRRADARCVSLPPMSAESLPLFPLHTVLLPGAALGLRVFEPRYLDLVRECGRSGGGFGICLIRSEEHTSELQSLMRISYAVFCLNKKNKS